MSGLVYLQEKKRHFTLLYSTIPQDQLSFIIFVVVSFLSFISWRGVMLLRKLNNVIPQSSNRMHTSTPFTPV